LGSEASAGKSRELNLIILATSYLPDLLTQSFRGAFRKRSPAFGSSLGYFFGRPCFCKFFVCEVFGFLSGGHFALFFSTVFLRGVLDFALFGDFLFERISS
jgi:hypothetical protein